MNWDIIKTAVAAFFGACIATLQPVHNAMLLLLIFAACDILFGILAGLIAARERFSFKKFILAAGYLLVYLGIVVMVYAVGKYQDDTQEAVPPRMQPGRAEAGRRSGTPIPPVLLPPVPVPLPRAEAVPAGNGVPVHAVHARQFAARHMRVRAGPAQQ